MRGGVFQYREALNNGCARPSSLPREEEAKGCAWVGGRAAVAVHDLAKVLRLICAAG